MPLEYCEHVYKQMNANPCPKCSKDTHETDWAYQTELHKDWISSGKAKYEGWTSI